MLKQCSTACHDTVKSTSTSCIMKHYHPNSNSKSKFTLDIRNAISNKETNSLIMFSMMLRSLQQQGGREGIKTESLYNEYSVQLTPQWPTIADKEQQSPPHILPLPCPTPAPPLPHPKPHLSAGPS